MAPFSLDATIIWVIAGAAAVTYSLRLGGLLLSDRLPKAGRFKKLMDALPGTILLSLVAPGIVSAGLWGCVAAAVTALLAYKTGNVFVAMLAGIISVAAQRQLGL